MNLRVGPLPKVRVLPNPEQSLRSLVERAPQAEAWADRTLDRWRPTLAVIYNIRRRLATGAVAALALWLFVHVMFGANGMVVYRQKKMEYQVLQKDIDVLQKENDSYTQQIQSLQTDPKTIEKEAREQLHYARPGEVIYVAPPTPPPQHPSPPESKAAQK
jgi:cell division protein FtsB